MPIISCWNGCPEKALRGSPQRLRFLAERLVRWASERKRQRNVPSHYAWSRHLWFRLPSRTPQEAALTAKDELLSTQYFELAQELRDV